MTDIELGIALGLIVGEGSFTGDRKQPNLSVRLAADDTETIALLKRILGGYVYGPYPGKPPRKGAIVWRASGPWLVNLIPMLDSHLPISRKRTQYLAWKHKWDSWFAHRAAKASRRAQQAWLF